MFGLGGPEILLLLVLGVLLFGKRLPDIGRSLGKTIVDFKQGMKGIETDVPEATSHRQSIEPEPLKPPARVTPSSAPKFDDAQPTTLPPKL